MNQPSLPKVQHQGPAEHCIIQGHRLGWVSCTCYAGAMGIDQATLGQKRPSGCEVRGHTGDTIGGTTIRQVQTVAANFYHVHLSDYVGSSAATPKLLAKALYAGMGILSQGYTGPLIHTDHKSTNTGVNHAVHAATARGWHKNAAGLLVPTEVLVYDPAADGRRDMADSPDWWSWGLYLAFGANLHPWGENDHRILGKGRMYAGIWPDTEPHVHLKTQWGATKTPVQWPDRQRIKVPVGKTANVRSEPDDLDPDHIVRKAKLGDLFVAWQVTKTGVKPVGSASRTWYGNHSGTEWVHASNLSHIGGTT